MRFILIATVVPLLLAFVAISPSQDRQPVAARKPRLPLTVAKETTFFTGPLRENGSVDYVEALNRHFGKGVTPENNAVVPLLRAFGGKEIPKTARAEFYRRLGIKPLADDGLSVPGEAIWAGKLTGVARERAEKRWFDEWDRATRGPWRPSDCPLIAKWLDANSKALASVNESGRRPRWYLPIVPDQQPRSLLTSFGVPTSVFPNVRTSARMLMMRAYRSIAKGNVDSAIEDLLACHRLARHLDQDGLSIISCLVADAVESIAVGTAINIIQSGKLTNKQASKYRRELESLGPLKGVPETYRIGDRCFSLDFIVYMWRRPINETFEAVSFVVEVKGRWNGTFADNFDLDIVLRSINSFYDRLYAVAKIPDPLKRRPASQRLKRHVDDLIKRTKRLPGITGRKLSSTESRKIASLWLGDAIIAFNGNNLFLAENNYLLAIAAQDRANTRYDLTRVALALAAYRAERGKFPERLPALVPRYIPALPVDRFSGKPLKFRLTKKAFLLYSVGENGRDDGGKGDRQLDIVVGG